MDNNSDEALSKHLLNLGAEWAKAIVSNDPKAIASFMSEDWVMVSWNGISDKQHFLSFVESGDLTHSAMDMIDGTARVRFYGDTAVLTARVTNTAHYKGHEFPADEWTTDVFVKINGEWKCVLSHITPAEQQTDPNGEENK
jgi:ketosteroid isomerase-like protein